MSLIALLVLAFAVVPAFAVAALGWLALADDVEDLSSLTGFEGMHFENP
jgi:hypothetical protein